MSIADQQLADDYDDLNLEETWDEHIPDSRHEEMLRQDRNRLITAAISGILVACVIVGGASIWVATMRAPAYSSTSSSALTASPGETDLPAARPAVTAALPAALPDANAAAAARNDIEAKLRSLAPHEALAVSRTQEAERPKRVQAVRIETKVD